ncbi:MAG: beta-lactamase family protein [Pseudomonadales bacterium]|nr:beta-lactamase family protein [Pseudomonadales bacterium]
MKIKFLLNYLLFGVALFSVAVQADDHLPIVSPEEVGFDSTRLTKIDSFYEQKVANGELAGIVTLVARQGKIAHFSAVGYQDVQRQIPMQTDTIFRIYSMTKAIATTALMQLYEEGAFQLRDPLSRYIPEFANLKVLRTPTSDLDDTVELERQPTVQDLLRHTAGLSHGLGRSEYDQHFVGSGIFSTETSLEEMMTLLSEIPLMNQPGSQYRYSVGPDVALRLVEVLSGMEADEYLAQKLFAPLGMSDTGYWVGPDKASRLGPVHWMRDDELVPIDEEYGQPRGGVLVEPWSVNSYTFEHEFKGGSYGLLSTAEDYWKFAQAMLNGGELNGEKILGSRTVDFMTSDHFTEQQRYSPATTWGLGFSVVDKPGQVGFPFSEGTFFWGGAAATTFWIDPVEEIVVVGMTQHMATPGTGDIRGQLAAMVYSALID